MEANTESEWAPEWEHTDHTRLSAKRVSENESFTLYEGTWGEMRKTTITHMLIQLLIAAIPN